MISYLIPDMPSTESLIPYLKEIETNHWYSNFGPLYHSFRQRLADECFNGINTNRLTLVSSGTSAIELALRSLKLPKGSKVLTSSFTFPATVQAILNADLTPVVSDINKDSWQLTPTIAKRCMQLHDIKAIVPVAVFGMPISNTDWNEFYNTKKTPIIIDAAAALLSQPIDDSLIYAFSLHATKPLGTGEGGLIVSRTKEDATSIKKASNFGFEPNRSILLSGTNAKISEYHCAVGLAQLDRLTDIKEKRRNILKSYTDLFLNENLPITFQEGVNQHVPASLYFVLDQANIGEVFEKLLENNIETRRLYWPLIQNFPAFRNNVLHASINFKNAQYISSKGLALPFYSLLSTNDIEQTVSTLAGVLFKQAVSK